MSEAPTLDNIVASKAAQDDFVRTRWWWIRHAPVRVDEGRIYGQWDLPCDCSDVRVFSALAALLPRKAVWITSHLTRTRQTAQAILAAGDFEAPQEILQDQDLAEQHLGDWQGLDRRTFLMNRKQEPELVLVCRRGRARAERRKLPRFDRAGRRRDRARERGSPGRRHRRRRAWRNDPRGAGHCSRPAAARRVRFYDRQLLAHAARPLSEQAGRRMARADGQSAPLNGAGSLPALLLERNERI